MLETEREMYQAFAEAVGLGPDLTLAADIIDGRRQADETLAESLAAQTATRARTWMAEGQGPVRQVGVRLWWLKQGRLAAVDVSEAWFVDEPKEGGRE